MFYYKRTRKGTWRWAFVASNGQMSASTETFPTRSNAKRAAYNFATAAANQVMEYFDPKNFYSLKNFQMLEWNQRPGA